MPCSVGSSPVIIVVCDGHVTVGTTPTTPSDHCPSRMRRRRFGIFNPSLSLSLRYRWSIPSMEMTTTGCFARLSPATTSRMNSITLLKTRLAISRTLIDPCDKEITDAQRLDRFIGQRAWCGKRTPIKRGLARTLLERVQPSSVTCDFSPLGAEHQKYLIKSLIGCVSGETLQAMPNVQSVTQA